MSSKEEKKASVYDYVIIGAGASGPIVANSLATDGFTVLLLEAGLGVDAEDKDVWDPQRWFKVQADPVIEWGYHSTAQKNLNGRSLSMQQSRCLGGCTIHNAMVYVRGGQTTYNYWEQNLGCKGWGYKSLEPLFDQLEKKIGVLTAENDELCKAFYAAAQNQGIPYNNDYNHNKTEYGQVAFQFAIEETKAGLRRTTSYEKYIGPQHSLKGLTVEPGAFVHTLLFKHEGKNGVIADGVYYQDRFGELKTVHVNHEVILSAGTIASPKILLQSGVGPKAELQALGINVVKDLPAVGKNFYDDLGLPSIFTQKKALPPQPYGFITSGVFASTDPEFEPANPKYAQVNLEMQVCSSDLPGAPSLDGVPYYSVGMAAMHLKSRGSITLASADPREQPVVDPNYLSDPDGDDLKQCKAALMQSLRISWDESLNDWRGLPLIPSIFPNPEAPEGWTWVGLEQTLDQYLEDYVRASALSIQHYIGTCSMGTDPQTSVVGPDLKVHGISKLRVIDASVAPTPVTGNTAGVSYVIGAKGAQLLKLKSK
ncbi:GMC family oxidoreductase [Mucilaginibacter sp. AW1-3]